MKRIFLSYRRNDSAVFTGRLFDRLTEYYGAESVFLDIDSIPGAADFRDVVREHVQRCGVFLAVIGRQWAGPPDRPPRLDNPDDQVRIEIELAVAAKKPIIPVYCDDRKELTPADVPPSLQPLVYANARRVDPGRDFHHHVQLLRREVNRILFPSKLAVTTHVARRFARRNPGWLAGCGGLALAAVLARDPLGRLLLTPAGMSAAAERTDPAAFARGEGGVYQVARGLPDRQALVSETDIVDTVRHTRERFDAFALTGSVFASNEEALTDALRHGVRFRFLVLDHGEKNRANVELYFRTSGAHSNGIDWSATHTRQIHTTFVRLRREAEARYPGRLEVRTWKGPFLNSLWVRDSGTDNALGHVEVTYYGDASRNPCVRFGRLGPKMVASLQEQFDYLWDHPQTAAD